MYTVDIDTGGTMTDALVSDGKNRHSFKVDTTAHDYTVSFLACLTDAARHLDFPDTASFLSKVSLIRWSSTITTNVLGERRGSKVGLLVSTGYEKTLYGTGQSPVVDELVASGSIIGLPDSPTAADVMAAVKVLLESGVRRICVCLKDAFPDNSNEERIKSMIEDVYPDHIIGSVPVLLGSEMAPLRHDQTRAHYSLMNAYTHAQLATSLFKAEDLLREEHGWNGALLIGNTRGGVARIGKTKAVDTIESGPIFGTFGGAYMATQYKLRNVLCFDVGGTTTKASVIRDGDVVYQRGGELIEVPVQSSLAMLRSAVVGGGSIASVKDGVVVLGPESMGAAPGPACYALGGDSATVSDALLLLGYLDPANFLGGRRKLDVALAEAAIDKHVAKPLEISPQLAALAIRDEAVDMMAELVANILAETNMEAETATLFAFGGNGPMFAAFVAEKLGIATAYAFDLGPVFSAFGSSISDVNHTYERGLSLKWNVEFTNALAPVIDQIQKQAQRDLRGEGFDSRDAQGLWELDLGRHDAQLSTVSTNEFLAPASKIAEALASAVAQAGKTEQPVLGIRFTSRYVVGSHGISKRSRIMPEESPTRRHVRFDRASPAEIAVYRWESLNVGDVVQGPALVNGATLTCPVPPGWQMEVDEFGNARLKKTS